MADEIVLDENGVPMSDGQGGTESSTDTNTGQGNGTTASTTTTNSGGQSGTQSEDTSSDTQDAELVKAAVESYLAASAISLTFEQLVPLYVDNKLGFATLKQEYKKENPDVDPDEVDKAVDEERQNAIQEFGGDPENPAVNSTAKDELKKKYDDFISSLADIKKNMASLPKEFAKTTSEAVMPTTIGLGAPNPLSITLKLFNGISKIKRILDRVFASIAIFMASAKALGLDNTDGYNQVMSFIATPLRLVQGLISKQEADPKYQESIALSNYLETAKKDWPWGKANGVNYQDIESAAREGIHININGSTSSLKISIWPMEPKDRQKVVKSQKHYLDYYGANSDEKILKTYEAVLIYNDYLGFVTKKFKEEYKQIIAVSNENNNTSNSSSTTSDANSSGGSNNNLWKSNTYGLSGLSKEGTK